MVVLLGIGLVVLAIGILAAGMPYWAWVVPGLVALGAWGYSTGWVQPAFLAADAVFFVAAVAFGVRSLRQALISRPVLGAMSKMLPRMSDTERIALEAGTVWWDGELFSGRPDWRRLAAFKSRPLSAREQAFLEGPVEELCAMLDDWQTEQTRDLGPQVWEFVRKHGFFGMIIPEEYGGLGFSALAHSAVVTKVSSRNGSAAVTVMVPNSLGPGELLLHYGTEEQKRYFLPRLARGDEIPCFALTGPEAGSDAASTTSVGIVCKGMWEGKEVLGMRLTWRKRYITLAPIATLIGLAFRLEDPDHLLGDQEDLGITCALVPRNLPGIDIGKRHDPLFNSFLNGPTYGDDVFVPLDCIIGGAPMAGQGWRMLMECLAAGRSISLPAVACAAAQLLSRGVGAYATVREQFDTPIGRFEGIEEPLARIAGFTYVMDAARKLTAGAVDAGEKPAVVSAIVKRYLSEMQRTIVNDGMDVLAGAAICRGPRNLIARGYVSSPISITVEGANILTRCLIIFGQGAIRCHPYVQAVMRAARRGDLAAFDRAFWGHVGFVFTNMARSWTLGLTDGALARPGVGHPEIDRYMGRFTRMSSAFVMAADIAMATLGAQLKRAEKLSGRYADMLAWMYLGSATMKRFLDEGCQDRDLPFLRWGLQHALHEIEEALAGIVENLPNRPAAAVIGLLAFPVGRRYRRPSDALGAQVARALLEDRDERLVLSRDIYSPPLGEVGLGQLEVALDKVVQAMPVVRKLKDAIRAGKLAKLPEETRYERAVAAGVLTENERHTLIEADVARDDAIQVDSFDPEKMGAWIHPEVAELTGQASTAA